MDKITVAFSSFPDYSSNAKPLYEYMAKRYKDKMNFIWACTTDEMVNKLNEKGITAYKVGTKEYYENMKKVNVIFSTHCNILNEKNENSLYVELWHGISSKNIGYLSDNITESDKDWYSYAQEQVDYFIVPSDFWRVIFATRFNINYQKTLSIGYPKFDEFVYADAKSNLAKVLNQDISKFSKIIYYMPTFRKGCGRAQESDINLNNIMNIESYDEETLNNYLKDKNYLLCVKKHPSEELELKDYSSENIKIIKENDLVSNNLSVNDIINAADLMISDYSSLGVEFTFLNKPVIYLINDIEEYNKNRGFCFNNSSFWMPGYRVKDYTSLINAIDDSFSEKYKYREELENKKKLWFGNLEDGGCKNICDYLFDEDKLREGLAKPIYSKANRLQERVNELGSLLDEKNEVIAQREARIKELDDFISQMINSKGWQFLEKMRSIGKVFRKK